MNSNILVGQQIAKAIQRAKPQRIAVAYLGSHWRSYVSDFDQLKAVIVSPQLGTNPKAVEDLVERLSTEERDGWDRVFFHDKLHAKLYLGEAAAVFGSANLSHNGLDGEQLVELCTQTSARQDLAVLGGLFETVMQEAIGYYPNIQEKKARLRLLEIETRNNPDWDYSPMAPSFEKFKLGSPHQFYVTWYTDEEAALTEETSSVWEGKYEYCMSFAEDDTLELNKWILCWKRDKDRMPSTKKGSYYWMRLDESIPNGAVDEVYRYTKLAIMRKDRGAYKKRIKKAPFVLTRAVMEAFRKAYKEEGLESYLFQSESEFSLKRTLKGVEKLISAMKKPLPAG